MTVPHSACRIDTRGKDGKKSLNYLVHGRYMVQLGVYRDRAQSKRLSSFWLFFLRQNCFFFDKPVVREMEDAPGGPRPTPPTRASVAGLGESSAADVKKSGLEPCRASKRQLNREARREAGKRRRKEQRRAFAKRPCKLFREDPPDKVRYVVHGGIRHAEPYPFVFSTFAKRRWYGREILEVYATEFLAYSKSYYEQAIAVAKSIVVNGNPIDPSYIIRNGDCICHTVHRHEPPVSGEAVRIAAEDDKVVVVSKPAGIPMHPCGRYRHNSLLYIMGKRFPLGLRMVHRLDRLTSGLVILCKDSDTAARFSRQISQGRVQKTYLARVLGKFPERVSSRSERGAYLDMDVNGRVVVRAPIACADRRIGKMVCGSKAKSIAEAFRKRHETSEPAPARETRATVLKESMTAFERVSFNGHTSVVRCFPHTGRTHQIRVHLQFLGFPIANDPCYGGQLYESNTISPFGGLPAPLFASDGKRCETVIPKPLELLVASYVTPKRPSDSTTGESVPGCRAVCNGCKTGSYWNNSRRYCMSIWLHASSYKSKPGESESWSFNVPDPDWAAENYDSRAACDEKTQVEHDPDGLFAIERRNLSHDKASTHGQLVRTSETDEC